MRIICAWCTTETPSDTVQPSSSPITHGVCLECCRRFDLFPSEAIPSIAQSDVDVLPFGVIGLDPQNIILEYNAAETAISGCKAETVIGKRFFVDVAPCTQVQTFKGRLDAIRKKGVDAREAFEFVFAFKNGTLMVEIVFLYESSTGKTMVLVAATA